MFDLREIAILNTRMLSSARDTAASKALGKVRMAVRRTVVSTGRAAAFRPVYLAVYRFHVWVARTIALRFEGTRSIYLSAGMGRGEIRPGISDIDFVIFGDWSEKDQIRLLKTLAIVVFAMPLFDRENLGCIQTWDCFLRMNETNLFYAYHYASAKRNWKLVWGEDFIQSLPNLAPERRAGAAHLEMRRWWSVFIKMAIGQNVISRDRVFRNSLSFKTAADTLRAEVILRGDVPPRSRVEILKEHMQGADIPLRDRLLDSESSTFLRMEGDPREFLMPWLLQRLENTNARLSEEPGFARLAEVRVEGTAGERLIAPAVLAHAQRLAESFSALPGFVSAHLLPCAVFLSPDSLGLFLRFDPAQLPSAEQLRQIMDMHFRTVLALPQRLAVNMVLDCAAYTLEPVIGLELWSWMLVPQANPDVFTMLAMQEYVLLGKACEPASDAWWSRVSEELLDEELMVRRGAYARFGVLARPTAAENLRNLLRFLQLLVMQHRGPAKEVVLPVTLPAIRRTFAELAPTIGAEVQLLTNAMEEVEHERPVEADDTMQRVFAWLIDQGFAASTLPADGEANAGGSKNL